MSNRAHFTQVNRALDADGEPVAGAEAYFYATGTSTQVTVYADALFATPLSQPVEADADGIFREVFYPSAALVRVLVKAPGLSGAILPGYPIDNVGLSGGAGTATGVSFTPTDDIPATNVQAAIVQAAALAGAESALLQRSSTAWTTGGTGDDYSITPAPALTAYGDWHEFHVLADRENTGAATLNVNALGARPWRKRDTSGSVTALIAGDIRPGVTYRSVFDGTSFIISERIPTQVEGTNTFCIREPSGLQICSVAGVTAAFVNDAEMGYTWTFPQAFVENPTTLISPPSASSNYNGLARGDIAWWGYESNSNSAVTVIGRRLTGADVFVSGDTITNIRIVAVGRWF